MPALHKSANAPAFVQARCLRSQVMPDVFDLTNKYREQLTKREDLARRSILKDYRSSWRGLESKIDSTMNDLLGDKNTLAELKEIFTGEFGMAKAGVETEISQDKIGQISDLLMKKDAWNALESRIGTDFETIADSAAKLTGEHGNELGQTAAGHALEMLQEALKKEPGKDQIPPKELDEMNQRVRAVVEKAWLANSATLQQAFRKRAAEVAAKARVALRQETLLGLLTGARGAQILGRVKQTIDEREKDPDADPALVRALRSEYRITVQDGYRESLRFTFTESGRVTGWRWTSARTPKTCAVCWAMDGKIFPIDTPLKSHPHCRCAPVPVIEYNKPPVRKEGSTGNVAFAQIPASQQKDILGAKAFEAYQQGEFDLSDLIGVQYDTRFGVTLYRQSVDNAVQTSIAKKEDEPGEEIQVTSYGSLGRRPARRTGVSYAPAVFEQDEMASIFTQASFTETGGSLLYNSFSGGGGSSLGPKTKPKFTEYKDRGLSVSVVKGERQYDFEKRALAAHGRKAGLRGTDLSDFVAVWAVADDPDTYKMAIADGKKGNNQTSLSNDIFNRAKSITYFLEADILKDLRERQLDAYKKGRLFNVKDTAKKTTSDVSGTPDSNKNKGTGTGTAPVNTQPVDPNAPKLLGAQDVQEIYDSLPTFGIGGDGTFTLAFENSGKPITNFFILGHFIQQKFGGVMWGDKVNEYTTYALQKGVNMEVLERNDESDPRVYKLRFSPADLQKLARLKLEWDQEYMHQVLASERAQSEVNNMFLDFLKLYPNLGVGFIEQLINIPVDVINQVGDPVSMLPGYKESRFLLGLLGYETPDFKLFEVSHISLDAIRLKYKSEMFQRDGAKVEQGSLFIINLILLKRSITGVPKGPLENPLGLTPRQPVTGVPILPKGEPAKPVVEEPVAPKISEPTKPVSEPVVPKTPVETPATMPKTPAATPKIPAKSVPKTPRPQTPKTPRQKPVQNPKPVPKKNPSARVSQAEKPVVKNPAKQVPKKDEGYTGKWPPEPPVGKKPNVQTTEGADWRYQRYVNDAYKEGRSPQEILSRERWESSSLRPAQTGGRSGRSGGPQQRATRQEMVKAEGFTNTEKVQLGTRVDRKGKTVKNMIDLFKRNAKGGIDYVEVDPMTKGGLPQAGMRAKLKMEFRNLKENDSLIFVDSANRSRRIVYKYGEAESVIDTRRFTPGQ